MDPPDVPSLLPLLRSAGQRVVLDAGGISYFLSTIEVRRGNTPGMSRWRKRLFVATTRLTADAAEYFNLPNHTNFGDPNTTKNSTFGQITSTTPQNADITNDPRIAQ